MESLRDIKGIVNIPDYSIVLFMLILIFIIFTTILFIKFVIFRKKAFSKEEFAKLKLKKLNFNNSKECAYTISKYLPIVLKNADISFLDKYKYKKDVQKFSSDDLEKIKNLLEKIDV